jgi:hypothetical protein
MEVAEVPENEPVETVETIWSNDLYAEIPVLEEQSPLPQPTPDPHLENLLDEQDWNV